LNFPNTSAETDILGPFLILLKFYGSSSTKSSLLLEVSSESL